MSSVWEQSQQNDQIWLSSNKAEHLLKSLSLMQECNDTTSFCKITLAELHKVFGGMEASLFFVLSKNAETGSIEPIDGATGRDASDLFSDLCHHQQTAFLSQALHLGKSSFSNELAIISLVRNGETLGILFLQSSQFWRDDETRLLEQFSHNAARAFETTFLLQQAQRLAYQDALTSMGNRLNFKKEIQTTIENEKDNFSQMVVMQFVLDTLPELNIALGHSMGDELLRTVASQLRRLFPEAISLARTSGDGFGVCVRYKSEDELSTLPEVINELFDAYLPEQLKLPHLTPRIGLSVYPGDGETSDKLWQNTNIALANTKKPGTPNFCYYDNHIEAEIHGRITLNNALREGMSDQQLSLYYQPQICLKTGKFIGVEALLRWEREKGIFVPADLFIPIAEASGLLSPISDWVLREACLQRQKWTKQGLPEFPVAVNISLSEFQSDEFVPMVRTVLKETGMPARLLDIELTESVIMQDRGQTKRNMLRLKGLGVCLSIDDFGTGYSSLSYLSHLPASVLKIDKSFIDGITVNSDDAAIARTIVTLGHNLGMKVLAEGVENQAQIDFLVEVGCQEAQGYVFSKPVPASKIPELSKIQNFLELA